MEINKALEIITDSDDLYDGYGYLTKLGYEALATIEGADVVEVKHGKWVSETDYAIKCSECGKDFIFEEYNFCPDCGSDMRGDNNDA